MKKVFKKLDFLLYPLSIIYGMLVSIRNWAFDYNFLPVYEFDVPIISAGNLVAGGTGKTPLIEYLIRILKKEYNLLILSRGYKRKTRGLKLASKGSSFFEIGDEPKQIINKFTDINLAVDTNRVRAIKKMLSKDIVRNIDIILLDDAFQYRYIKPGISILLINYNDIFKKDFLLPYGRLRESKYQIRRADIIVITKVPENIKPIERRIIEKELKLFPYQSLYFCSIKYCNLKPLFQLEGEQEISLEKFRDYSILLVTGIAYPLILYNYLQGFSEKIIHLSYKDHYYYKKKDIENIIKEFDKISDKRKLIITTEKDAIRLKEIKNKEKIINLPVYYIPIEIKFLDNDKENFNKQIKGYVKKNMPYSRIYKRKDTETG